MLMCYMISAQSSLVFGFDFLKSYILMLMKYILFENNFYHNSGNLIIKITTILLFSICVHVVVTKGQQHQTTLKDTWFE